MRREREYPSPLEARREGERAFESGRGNPYLERDFSDSYEQDRAREDADRAFRWGRSSAEERAQEEAAERAAQERYFEQEQEPPYEEQQEPEPAFEEGGEA